MIVLHILSQKYLTGAEVYAVRIAEAQVSMGDQVTLISDTINVKTSLHTVCLLISSHNYFVRLRNVYKVAKFCRLNRVDVIHAHSRAACWVANLAAKLSGAAYVVTLHDMQKPHRSARLWNIYGHNMIAICEVVRDSFIDRLKVPRDHIKVIRNGL